MTDSLDSLYWRDELLQILYWFRGEGFGEEVVASDLLPFLNAEESFLQEQLDRLAEEGFVRRVSGSPFRYRLTEQGILEGGRRFADEFAGLTNQAHGECNNPNCACKQLGPAACESPHNHDAS